MNWCLRTRNKHVNIMWLGTKIKRYSTSCTKTKLSYYHKVGNEPFRQVTIGGMLEEAAQKWPKREALVSLHQDERITFAETDEQAANLAGGLLELGLNPGDRVALWGPNSMQWYITLLAAAKAGLISVNLNPEYQVPELIYALTKVTAKAIVTDLVFRTQDYASMLLDNRDKLPLLEHIILNSDQKMPGTLRRCDVYNRGSKNKNNIEKVASIVQPDDGCNIQFSSGTTGNPKGVLLNHFMLLNNMTGFGKRLDLHKKHHKICLQGQFCHAMGTTTGILAALTYGATVVLPGPFFNPHDSAQAIQKEKCTVIYGSPTMYVDLCSHLDQAVKHDKQLAEGTKSPERVMIGGAICSPEVMKQIKNFFPRSKISIAYGMTEIAVQFQSMVDDSNHLVASSVGCASDHVEVKVVDTDGRMVPMGTPGEIWFRSYATMLGYWADDARTKAAITQDGWMKSGDLFILQENGYGQIVGRIKDIIIRGSTNIIPKEIEHLLETHSEIIEAQVYGVPDPRMGEELCASLKLRDETASLTVEDVKEFCKGKIAPFKIPKYIEFVNEFPKTASGKIKTFVLRENMKNALQSKKE